MKQRFSFSLFFFLFLIGNISAQNSGSKFNAGSIAGNIIDNQSDKPIPFATIHLLPQNDTTKKIVQIADKNGSFDFEKVPFGRYRLSIHATGFKNYILDFVTLDL